MTAKEGTGSKNLLKHGAMQLVAGGSAGCIEVSIMHPLDLVKTRFQLQNVPAANVAKDHHHHYSGVFDCFRKMYKAEGLFSFWKGVIPPIMVETPKRAWKFFTFEQFKTLFNFNPVGSNPSPTTYAMAGLASGLSEAVIVNPFEAVKVKMQSNRARHKEAPSTSTVFRQMVHEEGLYRGVLSKGLTATMGRNGVFNMVYFGFYFSVKDLIPESKDKTMNFLRKLTLGLLAGSFASMFNIPFDVAKSRIQGPQQGLSQPYLGTFRTIARVYREEGILALYKGLLPKVMRLGPGGAIMLLVYEHVYTHLQQKYPD